MNKLFIIIIMTISTIIGSFGAILLKKGAEHFHIRFNLKGVTDILRNWKIILGLFLYGLSTIAFIYMLKSEKLSMLYPLTSMGYIFIAILSVIFLKEHINVYKMIGISSIVAGVILVTL